MIRFVKQAGILSVVLLASLCLSASHAFAACSSPSGNAGDVGYSSIQNIMAYCNGTSWIAMGNNSAVSFGTLTSPDFCTATSGTAISCSTAPTGTGNVVLSSSPTLTGTIGGASSTWTGQVAIGTTTLSGALNISGTATATTFSGAFSGSGSGLTGIGTASLGGITGTPSATTFLAGNGTWATASGGSMTYPGAGIPNSTGSAWGTSYGTTGTGSVVLSASPTLTGTVTAGTFSGSGASLTSIGTGNLSATGTASSSTYLRGDNTWHTPIGGATAYLLQGTYVVSGNSSNEGVSPSVLYVSSTDYTALQFDLSLVPSGRVATKAYIVFWPTTISTPGSFTVYPCTSSWSPSTISGTVMPTLGSSIATGTVSTVFSPPIDIDITAEVNSWLSGGASNYGVVLEGVSASFQIAGPGSTTHSGQTPVLVIW